VFVDKRVFGKTRYWAAEPRDWHMAFPIQLRGTAVFLGLGSTPDDPDAAYGGTGFFMSVEEEGERFTYLVTADHNVSEMYADRSRYPIARLNDELGNAYSLSLSNVRWFTHPTDASVDVAVCEFNPPRRGMFSIGRENCVNHGVFSTTQSFGIGDEVVIVGLFRFAYSKRTNVPIVRTGNLAMIPPDPVPVKEPYSHMEAYLVEARSLGGLSGAPAFIGETMVMELKPDPLTGDPRQVAMRGGFAFLGLTHGHWDINEADLNAALPAAQEGGVNIGVAIIVPAYKILEVLDSDELRERRQSQVKQRKAEEHDKAALPVMDSGFDSQQSNFDRAASALFQVPKSAVDEAEAKRPKRKRKKDEP
jgi:hypothetical protein